MQDVSRRSSCSPGDPPLITYITSVVIPVTTSEQNEFTRFLHADDFSAEFKLQPGRHVLVGPHCSVTVSILLHVTVHVGFL